MISRVVRQLRPIAVGIGIRTARQFRLALRGLMVTVTVLSAFAIGLLTELQLFLGALVPLAVLLAAAILESALGDYITEQNYPFETERMLGLLEERLGYRVVDSLKEKLRRVIEGFQACDTARISGTVHVKVELPPSPESHVRHGLLQLTDYVGPHSGSKGRITTLERGVIGRCARTGKAECANFADLSDYRRRMVEEFGFSREEAEMHATFARSYLAEPLVVGQTVIGVLYFFTAEPQVFPQAARGCDLTAEARHFVDLLKVAGLHRPS